MGGGSGGGGGGQSHDINLLDPPVILTAINQCFKLEKIWQLIFNSLMENTHWGEKATNSEAKSELIQYKSNEVYYESDVVFLKQLSVQEEEPVKWRVQVIMLNIFQLWGKMTSMTSMRIASL